MSGLVTDDPEVLLDLSLRYHSHECARLGSRLYADLLAHAAADLAAGGVVAAAFAGRDVRLSTAAGLRLMRTVHRLVLTGRAPALAAHFPSVGGTAPPHQAWPAMRAALAANLALIGGLIDEPLQTNEVGRCAALYGGLIAAVGIGGPPVRLLEIGASAGLNLLADHYAYEINGLTAGAPGSAVRLCEPWRGNPHRHWQAITPRIVARAGCDPHPVDPATTEGRLALLSSTWADQPKRCQRMRAAFDVAQQVPALVARGQAADWLGPALARPAPGVLTVVWHSLVWQYLDDRERARVDDILAAAGQAATGSAPLARITLEPDAVGRYEVWLTRWPGGIPERIGQSEDHGIPTTWLLR